MRGTPAMLVVTLIFMANKCRLVESVGLDIIGNVQGAFNFFNDAYGVIKGDLPISALLSGSTGVTLDRIMDSVGDISNKIDDLSTSFTNEMRASDMKNARRFNQVQAAIEQVMTEIPKDGKLNEDMREFRAYTSRVNSLYSEFEYYSKNKSHFNEQTINYFIEAIVSRNRGDLLDILQQMFTLVIQVDWYYSQGILELYAHNLRKTDAEKLCGIGLSPQVRYYKMYETIFMTEARGFIMEMFAYSVKSTYARTTYLGELDLVKRQMLDRIQKYFLATMNHMRGLPTPVESCDAPKYKFGIDYVSIDYAVPQLRQRIDYLPDRSISLMDKTSNTDENMVVSGIRFVKRSSGMIDYQIKEAKLLPQGQVAPNGTWQELPEMNETLIKKSEHYYVVNYDTIFLIGDIQLDPERVVVGVSLDYNDQYLGKYKLLIPYVYGMKFDAESGQLIPGTGKWVGQAPKEERDMDRKKKSKPEGDPLKAERNHVDSGPNEGYYFNHLNEDQVIPYFDARPVEMGLPSFAVKGLGIFHRGAPGHGGFFNFRLLNVDLADYMQQHDIMETATDDP